MSKMWMAKLVLETAEIESPEEMEEELRHSVTQHETAFNVEVVEVKVLEIEGEYIP